MTDAPDIRIGLIGLSGSGKTHLVAVLDKIYWGTDQATALRPENEMTRNLLQAARQSLMIDKEPISLTPKGKESLYRAKFKRAGNWISKGFEYTLEILDVPGEDFLKGSKIYNNWLIHCNALVFLIDGIHLVDDSLENTLTETYALHIQLFEYIRDNLFLFLSDYHTKNDHKVFMGVCISKYDIFERERGMYPEKLIEDRLAPVYQIVEQFAKTESWVKVRWYGISSLGYVWDKRLRHYVDADGNKALRGNRMSQLRKDGKDLKIYSPNIRPEGIEDLFEDIRKHTEQNRWELPSLDRKDLYETSGEPDYSQSWSADIPKNDILSDDDSDEDDLSDLYGKLGTDNSNE